MSDARNQARDAGQPEEMPLWGGNVSTVVRAGNTVRRSSGLWTPAVHAWLRHLEKRGFSVQDVPGTGECYFQRVPVDAT